MNADKRRLDLFEQFAFSKNHRGRGGAQRIMEKIMPARGYVNANREKVGRRRDTPTLIM